MIAIAPSDRENLDAYLASADIPAAFDLLKSYPDLRHTDLPSVDKASLKAIAAKPQVVRQMALGFASISPSIRRFCKKYFPKLGASAAKDLLYLFIESLDPLRPVTDDETGLLGSCGGYVSPVGQAIREADMSMEVRRPEIEVYSVASRFAREVLDLLPSALAATDFETFLLASEYYFGLGVFYSMTPKGYESPLSKQSYDLLAGISYHITNAFKEVLRSRAQKGDTKLFEAMQTWICREIILEQECWQGTPVETVRTRFLHLRRQDVATMNLHWTAAEHFMAFPQAQRIALYRLLQDSLSELSERNATITRTFSFRYYQERYPDEVKLVDGETSPAMEAFVPIASLTASPTASQTVSAKSSPSFAVDRAVALSYLLSIANLLKLHGVARAIHFEDLDYWQEDFPSPSSNPDVLRDEELLQTVRQFVKENARRVSSIEELEEAQSKTYSKQFLQSILESEARSNILLEAIAGASWGEVFFDLLQRAMAVSITNYQQATERGEKDNEEVRKKLYLSACHLMQAALTFLPDRLWQQWMEMWRDRLAPLHPFTPYYFGPHDTLPKLLVERFPDEAPFLMLEFHEGVRWPNTDCHWQFSLAQAYAGGGDRGIEAVRQHLASASLDLNAHYRRSDWHSPYQWLITQLWEQRDAELLAIACDRCAIPMYWKGEKAYSPIVKNYRDDRGFAACTSESSDGAIAVQDICKLVCERQPDFLLGIVRNNMQLAAGERAACTLLTYFASLTDDLAPFRDCMIGLLELLESPNNYAVSAGLDIFISRPELAAEVLTDVLLACDRGLASTATAVAKLSVECLGQLTIFYPDAREQAAASLENALDFIGNKGSELVE